MTECPKCHRMVDELSISEPGGACSKCVSFCSSPPACSAPALVREWDNECGVDILRCGEGIMGYERHMARDLHAALGALITKWDVGGHSPRQVVCPTCGGRGMGMDSSVTHQPDSCPTCDDTGYVSNGEIRCER